MLAILNKIAVLKGLQMLFLFIKVVYILINILKSYVLSVQGYILRLVNPTSGAALSQSNSRSTPDRLP